MRDIVATIEVNQLRLYAYHGVMAQERIVGNEYEVTVHVGYPIEEAMAGDDLEHTLNYAHIVEIVKDVMAQPSQLLEHVAGRLRMALIEEFPLINGGMIRIAKITPPIPVQLQSVAVKIRW